MIRLLSTFALRLASWLHRLGTAQDRRAARQAARRDVLEMAAESRVRFERIAREEREASERRDSMRALARTPSDTAEHRAITVEHPSAVKLRETRR